jgi:starvation-inducible DNA-binding protein
MEELIDSLKKTLADSFAFYLKAHNFHWNVEGSDFAQLHGFFGDLYEEVFGAVDAIAEHIRVLGDYAPASFSRYSELSSIEDAVAIPVNASIMVSTLREDNAKVIATLIEAYNYAEEQKKLGLANFIQDRIDAHEKHAWMLRSIEKA